VVLKIRSVHDHRVSEGLTVTKFLSELKSRILSYYVDTDGMANLVCYACEKSMAEGLSPLNSNVNKIVCNINTLRHFNCNV